MKPPHKSTPNPKSLSTLVRKVPGGGGREDQPERKIDERTQTFAIPSNQQMTPASANPVSMTRVTTRHDFA